METPELLYFIFATTIGHQSTFVADTNTTQLIIINIGRKFYHKLKILIQAENFWIRPKNHITKRLSHQIVAIAFARKNEKNGFLAITRKPIPHEKKWVLLKLLSSTVSSPNLDSHGGTTSLQVSSFILLLPSSAYLVSWPISYTLSSSGNRAHAV